MRVEYSTSDSGIGVPYPPADRPEGNRNYGYMDLRKRPELIDGETDCRSAPVVCREKLGGLLKYYARAA
jgi:hypothetical protein